MTAEPENLENVATPPKQTPAWIVYSCGIVAIGICVLIGASPFYGWFGFPDYRMPTLINEYGDAFGFTNAIVSAFAFAALIITMFWQREELQQQRYEIMQMRKANEKSALAQEESLKALLTAAKLNALESLRASASQTESSTEFATAALRSRLLKSVLEKALFDIVASVDAVKLKDDDSYRTAEVLIDLHRFLYETNDWANGQPTATGGKWITKVAAAVNKTVIDKLTQVLNDNQLLDTFHEEIRLLKGKVESEPIDHPLRMKDLLDMLRKLTNKVIDFNNLDATTFRNGN